jgi:hypothetical protein
VIFPSCRCAFLECAVPLLQVAGVVGLCLMRLLPSTRWADGGRVVLVGALIGLGLTGALLGTHDSEFALFAGGSVTALLIGVTLGGGPIEEGPEAPPRPA